MRSTAGTTKASLQTKRIWPNQFATFEKTSHGQTGTNRFLFPGG